MDSPCVTDNGRSMSIAWLSGSCELPIESRTTRQQLLQRLASDVDLKKYRQLFEHFKCVCDDDLVESDSMTKLYDAHNKYLQPLISVLFTPCIYWSTCCPYIRDVESLHLLWQHMSIELLITVAIMLTMYVYGVFKDVRSAYALFSRDARLYSLRCARKMRARNVNYLWRVLLLQDTQVLRAFDVYIDPDTDVIPMGEFLDALIGVAEIIQQSAFQWCTWSDSTMSVGEITMCKSLPTILNVKDTEQVCRAVRICNNIGCCVEPCVLPLRGHVRHASDLVDAINCLEDGDHTDTILVTDDIFQGLCDAECAVVVEWLSSMRSHILIQSNRRLSGTKCADTSYLHEISESSVGHRAVSVLDKLCHAVNVNSARSDHEKKNIDNNHVSVGSSGDMDSR